MTPTTEEINDLAKELAAIAGLVVVEWGLVDESVRTHYRIRAQRILSRARVDS